MENAATGDRILVCTDSSSAHAQLLTAALLGAAQSTDGFAIAAVVDTSIVGTAAFAWACVTWLLARCLNPTRRAPAPRSFWSLRRECRKVSVPYRRTGRGDPDPSEVQANVLVSIYVMKKFSRAFLEQFDYAVNYHNGALPAYRGVLATNWELYRGERSCGFTFHRLSEGIDEGNVLVAGSVEAGSDVYKFQVERRKTFAATTRWPEVLRLIGARAEGAAQQGPAGSYTRRRFHAIRDVRDPSSISRSEMERRIRCFESVRLTLDGRVLPVSAIVASAGGARFELVTADGARMAATRFDHLPYSLYRFVQTLRRLRAAAWSTQSAEIVRRGD